MVPPHGHWNGVMYILEYLWRTTDMSSFYSEEFKLELISYTDAEYLSDPHKERSQTRYLFAYGGTIISWRLMKKILQCRNKSPSWSKSKVRLVEINDTPYSKNVWFFFKKEYTNHNVRRLETSSQEIKWCFNQGSIIRVALFFPRPRFFPTGFSWQGF